MILLSFLAAFLVSVSAKNYTKCDLLVELEKSGASSEDVQHLRCLLNDDHLDSTRISNDKYGIFGIPGAKYCGATVVGGECGMLCSKFHDEDFKDDIECAKKLYDEMVKQNANFTVNCTKQWENDHCPKPQEIHNTSEEKSSSSSPGIYVVILLVIVVALLVLLIVAMVGRTRKAYKKTYRRDKRADDEDLAAQPAV